MAASLTQFGRLCGQDAPLRLSSDACELDRSRRGGFTLVELLVTISIIAILASLMLGALFQSQELAREARTKSLIARLNSELMSRYETYRTRRLPIDPSVGREIWGTGGVVTGILTHLGATRVLQSDELEEYYDPTAMPPAGTNGYPDPPFHTTKGAQIALKALAARRELIRREMPDRYQDLFLIHNDNATSIPYGVVNVTTGAIPNPFTQSLNLATSGCRDRLVLAREFNQAQGRGFATDDWATDPFNSNRGPVVDRLYPVVPALMSAYQRRINSNLLYQFQTSGGATDTILQKMAQKHEGAECLHLLLTTANGEDDTGRALFLENEVRDTDGDGMPEFIDGWGRPITWLRWPAGFVSPLQPADAPATPEQTPLRLNLLNSLATTPTARDPFDIRGVAIYLDPSGPHRTPPPADANSSTTDEAWTAYPTGTSTNCPWGWGFATTPLIVSPGRDGEFGLNLGRLFSTVIGQYVVLSPPAGGDDLLHLSKCSTPYSIHRYRAGDTGFAQLGAVIYGDTTAESRGGQVHGDNIHSHALGTR